MNFNRLFSFLVVGARLALLAQFFQVANCGSWMFGLVELAVLLCSVRGLVVGVVDSSAFAFVLPISYLFPLLLRPVGYVPFFDVFLGFCIGLQWLVLFRLWSRVSVGVAVFVGLADSGVYSLIRHPLALVQSLTCVAFCCTFQCLFNWCLLPVVVLAHVVAVLLEEHFLFRFGSYRSYAWRVRWRWIPGLW